MSAGGEWCVKEAIIGIYVKAQFNIACWCCSVVWVGVLTPLYIPWTCGFFIVGNHRLALLTTETFLNKNGRRIWTENSQETYTFNKNILQYNIDEIAKWLENGPKEGTSHKNSKISNGKKGWMPPQTQQRKQKNPPKIAYSLSFHKLF